jgi:hypothetical protein
LGFLAQHCIGMSERRLLQHQNRELKSWSLSTKRAITSQIFPQISIEITS